MAYDSFGNINNSLNDFNLNQPIKPLEVDRFKPLPLPPKPVEPIKFEMPTPTTPPFADPLDLAKTQLMSQRMGYNEPNLVRKGDRIFEKNLGMNDKLVGSVGIHNTFVPTANHTS